MGRAPAPISVLQRRQSPGQCPGSRRGGL